MATIQTTITLVDNMSSKLSEIETSIGNVKDALKSLESEQTELDKFSWDGFLQSAEAAGAKMSQIGAQMALAITAPFLMFGKSMYQGAVDYESAFAGVRKTVDPTVEQAEQLYSDLLSISETTPTGFIEAAKIMETAGQLGVGQVDEFGADISEQYRIATEDLGKFTRTYINLQEATNIQGEEGAKSLARFMNVSGMDMKDIDRVGGVITQLGNKFATSEEEIVNFQNYLAPTAASAKMSGIEMLALATALSSVGIRAEAGGSAAGKLIKNMQLAAEVGGQAQEKIASLGEALYDFNSGREFSNWWSFQKGEDKAGIADDLNMTIDAVQELADSWVKLDQYAEVMNMSTPEFIKSWNENKADSLLTFFQSLNNLDEEAGNSVLAQLAEMDLTEIRLSNLIAAMSINPDLYEKALAYAREQFAMDPEHNALAEETLKRYETQESQNEMLKNKFDNTMADFGDNLVKALNPALEVVNGLLDGFNQMSETDQTNLLKTLGAVAVLGPSLSIAGKGIELVSKGIQTIEQIKDTGAIANTLSTVGNFLTNTPVGNVIALAAGIAVVAAAIDAIPSELDRITEGAVAIPISIDGDMYGEVMSQIQEVQAALNGLKAGEIDLELEKTSSAVSAGIATNNMFGTALAYEAAKANATIDNILSNYGAIINGLQNEMKDAVFGGDKEKGAELKYQIDTIRIEADSAVKAAKVEYSEKISDLFNGMATQFEEESAALEKASVQYDLLSAVERWGKGFDVEFDAAVKVNPEMDYDSFVDEQEKQMMQAFSNLGYGTERDIEDMAFADGFRGVLDQLYTTFVKDTVETLQIVSDNPIFTTWLQSILDNPGIAENLDQTAFTGALSGLVKLLDLQQAMNQAVKEGETSEPQDLMGIWGKYFTEGLADSLAPEPVTVPAEAEIATPEDIAADLPAAEPVTIPAELAVETPELTTAVNTEEATAAVTAETNQIQSLLEQQIDEMQNKITATTATIAESATQTSENVIAAAAETGEQIQAQVDNLENLDFNAFLDKIDPEALTEAFDFTSIIDLALQGGVDFGTSYVEGMKQGITAFDMSAFAENFDFSALSTQANEGGLEWANMYGQGIEAGSGTVLGAVENLCTTSVSSAEGILTAGGTSVGSAFTSNIAAAISAGSGAVLAAVSSVCNAAVSTATGIMSAGGSAAGSALAAGMAAGIAAGEGAVAAAAASLAQSAVAAANAAVGIASPAKATIWSGEMMAEGYIVGIERNEERVSKTASSLTTKISANFNETRDTITGNIQDISDVVSRLEHKTNAVNMGKYTISTGIQESVQAAKDLFDSSMGDLITYTERGWNESAWDDISFFANLEKQKLLSDAEDEVKISDTDVKKIRELAEREVINKFTTAEIKVEMNNTNHINSELDLDGIADQLGDLVTQKLEAAAEGVYQ